MAVGLIWLTVVNKRRPGVLADIEADLERTSGHKPTIEEENPAPTSAPSPNQPAVAG
jgi:hypothetical protein